MLQRQNLYVAKTKFICCKTKKHGARCERSRRGFFSPKKRHSYFLKTQNCCFCRINTYNRRVWCCKDTKPLKSTVLGLSAPAGASYLPKRDILTLRSWTQRHLTHLRESRQGGGGEINEISEVPWGGQQEGLEKNKGPTRLLTPRGRRICLQARCVCSIHPTHPLFSNR